MNRSLTALLTAALILLAPIAEVLAQSSSTGVRIDAINNTLVVTQNATGTVPGSQTGTALKGIGIYSWTLTPSAIAASGVSAQTFAIQGLMFLPVADIIFISGPTPTVGCRPVGAKVAAHYNASAMGAVQTGVLSVDFINDISGPCTPKAGSYTALVISPSTLLH